MNARTAVAAVLAGAASVGALFLSAPANATGCNSQTMMAALPASGAIANVPLAQPTCVGDWAQASTTAAPPAQSAAVLFHRVNGTWQYVTYGSYWDCVGVNGVPPEAAAMFAGCYQH